MLGSVYLTPFIGSAVDINTVTNGVGISVKDFSTNVDVRDVERLRPGGHGGYSTLEYFGRRRLRFEGDILGTTPTNYWTQRLALMSVINMWAGQPGNMVDYFTLQMTLDGAPEVVTAKCNIDGWPEIPINRMGATLSQYMIALKANDPRMYGPARTQSFVTNAALAALANLAGNTYTWPVYRITGPVTNPLLRVQGQTNAWSMTGTITSGNYIDIWPQDFKYYSTQALNVYDLAIANWDTLALDPRRSDIQVRLTGTSSTGASNVKIDWNNAFLI